MSPAKRTPSRRAAKAKPGAKSKAKPRRKLFSRAKATAKPKARKRRAKAKPGPAAPKRRPGPRPGARSKPKAPPRPAFPQTAGASTKDRLLFRMVRARASVVAAIQGMSALAAERPLGEGKWNTRETILHLVTRDRARLREMEAALRGARPSWQGIDLTRQAEVNEEDLGPLRRLNWEDSVRLLHTTRQQLMEAVESIPEEPEAVWREDHPVGWMFERLPPHDLHHAGIIKRRRSEPGE